MELPTSEARGLRACMRCGLVKTFAAFCDEGCPNCPFMQYDDDMNRAQVRDCTTAYFDGLVGMVGEGSGSDKVAGSESWVARWQHITTYAAPGLYALSTSEEMPKEMQDFCRDNNHPFVTPNTDEGEEQAKSSAVAAGGRGGADESDGEYDPSLAPEDDHGDVDDDVDEDEMEGL